MLEDAVGKLAPFPDEIVFVRGVTLGLLITDGAAAPIRGTTDVDVIAEIVTTQTALRFQNAFAKPTSQKTPASLVAGITVL